MSIRTRVLHRASVGLAATLMFSPPALGAQNTRNVRETGFQTELTLGGEIPSSSERKVFSASFASRVRPWDYGAFRLAAQYVHQSTTFAPSEGTESGHSLILLGSFDVPIQIGELSIAPSVGIGVVPIERTTSIFGSGGSSSITSNSAFTTLWSHGVALRYRHFVLEKQWLTRIGAWYDGSTRNYQPYLIGVRW